MMLNDMVDEHEPQLQQALDAATSPTALRPPPAEEQRKSRVRRKSLTPLAERHRKLLGQLSQFDNGLVQALRAQDIRLVRSSWLLTQPSGYRLQKRQVLEALERAGAVPSPLLSGDEAAELVRSARRGAGVVSHAWLTPGHPDPEGSRLAILQRALEEHPRIAGVFWECVCRIAHIARYVATVPATPLATARSCAPTPRTGAVLCVVVRALRMRRSVCVPVRWRAVLPHSHRDRSLLRSAM